MLDFHPPLLNSANPWATSKKQLQELYDCPHTGAITTRTSLLNGFEHDDAIHQYIFFGSDQVFQEGENTNAEKNAACPRGSDVSSLNTLGYSPLSLHEYLSILRDVFKDASTPHVTKKPVIFSVTGSPHDIVTAYNLINSQRLLITGARFLMEINLSCPNIAGVPPPAYSRSELVRYLSKLHSRHTPIDKNGRLLPTTEIGLKIPPYTHQGQFDDLVSALLGSTPLDQTIPISFITATNTLGNCLVLDPSDVVTPVLNSVNGTGIGGLAGAALHPLALGNVKTLRRMLDSHERLRHIDIIGVGGVMDGCGFKRMMNVGASAVAVGTALGSKGIGIFENIWKEVESSVPTGLKLETPCHTQVEPKQQSSDHEVS